MGVFRYNRYNNGKLSRFTTRDGLAGNLIRQILEDSAGGLWFNTSGAGLSCYDGNKFISFTDRDGLEINAVSCIFEDREGNIWLGYRGAKGLTRFNPYGLRNFGVQDGLPGRVVVSIAEDRQGHIWLSANGSVVVYDGKTFTEPISENKRLFGYVRTILADIKGNLWFGTSERGLFQIPLNPPLGKGDLNFLEKSLIKKNPYEGKNLKRFTTLDGLAGSGISSIIEDKDGNIWAGVSNEGGFSKYDGKKFTSFTVADGLTVNSVTCLAEDDDGNIWIGTWGGGINWYDGEQFNSFIPPDGFISYYVDSVFVDNRGQV